MTIAGRWRIVEMPGFETGHVDLIGPAFIDFDRVEFAFGALQATFTPGPVADGADLEWQGCDEMDPLDGAAWIEASPDGSISGEFNLQNGDDFAFTARPWPYSSTAC